MHLLTLFHFAVTECRPWFLFCLSWFANVQNTAVFESGEMPRRKGLEFMDYNKYRQCMVRDVTKACFSIWQSIHGECVSISTNPWGILNFIGVFLSFGMIINMMWHLYKEDCEYTTGQYLSFVFKMHKRAWYKVFAVIFLIFTGLSAIYEVRRGLASAEYALMFLTSQVPAIGICAYTAFTLIKKHNRELAMGHEEFKELIFIRPWFSFFQGNDVFEAALKHAFVWAVGEPSCEKRLKDIIDYEKSKLQGKNVLEILRIKGKKDCSANLKGSQCAAEDVEKNDLSASLLQS